MTSLQEFWVEYAGNRISGDGFKSLVDLALKIPHISNLGTSVEMQTPPISVSDVEAAASLVAGARVVAWVPGVEQSNTNTSQAANAMACALNVAARQIVSKSIYSSIDIGHTSRTSGSAECDTVWSVEYSFQDQCLKLFSSETGAPGLCPGPSDSRCVKCPGSKMHLI